MSSNIWRDINTNAFSKAKYAINGVKYGFCEDKSIRIAFYTAIIYSILSLLFCPTIMIKCLGTILISFWVIMELINCSIETTVDRIGLEYNKLSGHAKDLSAGASLVTISVVILITIFLVLYSIKKYKKWKKENQDKCLIDYIKWTFKDL